MKIIHYSKICEDQKIESDFGIELEAIARVLGKRGVKIEPKELSDAEKQTISIRTRSALKIKKGKSERVGHIPFGQKLAKDGIHLESNWQEQEVINQIALLHAKGLSVRKIARIMNLNKMFNRFGAKWNHESIHQLTKKQPSKKL
ncbi:MAG: recombinase family protein [Candidatus Babeliales bacterium]|nr:recombinase family protein [Candidatus Babeliales bacterium]